MKSFSQLVEFENIMIYGDNLYDNLKALNNSDIYPYHMPGHKRNSQITPMAGYYDIDITEIDGFDNLHAPEEILLDISRQGASLYAAEAAYLLVNGSTAGILTAIMASTNWGDQMLISRNCHKSVYHGAYLQNLELLYVMPESLEGYSFTGAISGKQIADKMDQNPNCRTVLITSPTYEGITSNIKEIAQIVHERNGILIVDSAHGAHLGFADDFPKAAMGEGADFVIISLHKTLPAMTQTGLLLIGKRVKHLPVQRYLSMIQTSSPSYVLMASIQESLLYMKRYGRQRLEYMKEQLKDLCNAVKACKHIAIANRGNDGIEAEGNMWDPSKIIIYCKDQSISGKELYDILLNRYHLQMEMAAMDYVLAMFTVADTKEAYTRLGNAICEIDHLIDENYVSRACSVLRQNQLLIPITAKGLRETMDKPKKEVMLEDAIGAVAAEFVNAYPPGIPVLVPGEMIGLEQLARITEMIKLGLNVQGITKKGTILVLWEN